MNHQLLATVLFASLLCGCTTKGKPDARDGAKYQFGSNSPVMNQEAAEAKVVAAMLAKQVVPPLDSPLVLEEVMLPPYPQSLQRSNVEGRVTVRFAVNDQGVVQDVTLVGAAPKSLVELAFSAVERWKFKPPIRDGNPTTLELTYWFDFVLQ